jgi:hypothetical protein
MSIKQRVAGAIQTASAIRVLANGSLRPAKKVSVMAGGALRAFFMLGQGGGGSTFALSAPTSVDGDVYSAKPARVNSRAATATPNGGVSPYRYLWERIDGDTRVSATTATTASSTFGATLFNDTADATFRCTATDAAGGQATATVAVTLTHTSSL